MKTIDQLTKTEKSLLLFMECAAVDEGGIYQTERTNAEDREIMDRWKAEGFIDHGRVASEYLTATRRVWIKLTPEAMALAQELRRARAERMWIARTWESTAEKRDAA
jgi:hypothetical protein